MQRTIAALAGRRIDPPDADARRFPLESVELVRGRIRNILTESAALVCSAACGADLIALEEAGSLRMRRRVVLPFPREQFRATSVVDRPGDWGAVYDRVLAELEASGDVVVLAYDPKDADAYAAANSAILEEAGRLSAQTSKNVLAVIVWEGKPRGEGDLTAAFREEAVGCGYRVVEIPTL